MNDLILQTGIFTCIKSNNVLSDYYLFQYKMIEDKVEGEQKEEEVVDPKKMQTKILIFKIIIVVLALVCCITIIFILAKSSQFFSFLFSLTT